MKNKFILDACCGNRKFWFNKKHPNAIYADIRENVEINPDIIQDFRKMRFKDKSFKLVVWDPPHIIQEFNPKVRILQVYGSLNPKTWKEDLKQGFSECWRVLEDYGVLVFKWSDCNKWANYKAKHKDILALFPIEPLFGSKTGKTGIFFTFMKIPK
jgi:hypothetical protein